MQRHELHDLPSFIFCTDIVSHPKQSRMSTQLLEVTTGYFFGFMSHLSYDQIFIFNFLFLQDDLQDWSSFCLSLRSINHTSWTISSSRVDNLTWLSYNFQKHMVKLALELDPVLRDEHLITISSRYIQKRALFLHVWHNNSYNYNPQHSSGISLATNWLKILILTHW